MPCLACLRYAPHKWECDAKTKKKLKGIAAKMLCGVCQLLEKPASATCQISSTDVERGFVLTAWHCAILLSPAQHLISII